MLNLKWKKVESSSITRPAEVDNTSSPTTVYIRKNIKEEIAIDEETNESYTVWNYDEAKIAKSEYAEYQAQLNNAGIQSLKEDIETLMLAYTDLYELILSLKG